MIYTDVYLKYGTPSIYSNFYTCLQIFGPSYKSFIPIFKSFVLSFESFILRYK